MSMSHVASSNANTNLQRPLVDRRVRPGCTHAQWGNNASDSWTTEMHGFVGCLQTDDLNCTLTVYFSVYKPQTIIGSPYITESKVNNQ